MTTVAEAVEEAREHLEGTDVLEYVTLDGAITSGASTLVVNEDTVGIERGTLLSIDEELLRVTAMNHSTKTATVLRGHLGSTAAAHDDGAGVEIDPRFPTWSIMRAMKADIRSWTKELFATNTVTITAEQGGLTTVGFDAIAVLESGSLDSDGRWARVPVNLVRNAASLSVQTRGGRLGTEHSRSILVTLAVPYDLSTFTSATDLETDVGIHPEAHDIAGIGAAARLMAPRETPRTSLRQQGNPRNREEVPPTHRLQTAAALKRWRNSRIAEEVVRLRGRWPLLGGG